MAKIKLGNIHKEAKAYDAEAKVRHIIMEFMPVKLERLNEHLSTSKFDFTNTDFDKLAALDEALNNVLTKSMAVVLDPGTKVIAGRYPWGKEGSD